jgi:hypothetical protein
MKHLQPFILIAALLITSCAHDKPGSIPWTQINGKSVPILKFKDIRDTIALDLSQLLDEVNFVKLETNDDIKLSSGKWTIGEKYLIGFCYNLGIFQFTSDGRFIRKLAGMGNGPQEVSFPIWTTTENENQILIFDNNKPKGFQCYDLNSGLFLKNIPIALEGQLKNFFFENDSTLICAPLVGTITAAGIYNVFWQNLSGKLLKGYKTVNNNGSFDNGDNLIYPVGDCFHLRPVNGDTIFEIRHFDKYPSFIIDPQNNLISSESDLGRTTFSIQTETPELMIISTFTVTEKESVGPNAFRSKGKSANYYIDKRKNTAYLISSFYNDYVGEKQGPGIIRNQTSDLKYVDIEALSLIKKIDKIKLDPNIKIINRELFIILGLGLKEDDNPVFLIGKITRR